ncbi:endoglucanase [Cryptococcus neoformans Bt63]|nr:endoglucanase [Cryptococcus neoformans var. grubii Bt63]
MLISLLALVSLSSLTRAQLTPSPTYSPPTSSAGLAASNETPNTQWSNVLGNSLWFYDAQRSGRLDEGTYGNRVDWRNDSALEDGSDWGLDLVGGWYDAGDYIKATFPLSFTLFALSWGALTHGQGYGLANQTAYLDGTLRWGFDWLMKAHPSDDVLFIQVGSEDVDNNYWGGDQDIPTPRPGYPINSSYPGTDGWAAASTAFSLGSLLYTPGVSYRPTSSSSPPTSPSLGNSTYASQLLTHAKSLYSVANSTTPRQTYYTALGDEVAAYASSDWQDDLCASALALALATNDSAYYADAYNYYVQYGLTGAHEVWNWDSSEPAIYVMFAEIASAKPELAQGAGLDVNLTGWQTEVENYFDGLINEDFKNSFLTKGGLLYWNGDSDEASLNPAMAAAMLMFKYAPMASSTEKTNSYNSFAQSQLNYMLGANPMSAPYMVGQHPNSPSNPHSAPASGGFNMYNIRDDPPTEAHVLYGAMVGGPLRSDQFWDWRDDWVQTEIALDYNAMIPTLASMQLMNNTADPPYVDIAAGTYSIPSGQPCDEALPCGGRGGLSGGAIAGIVVGVIVGVVLLVIVGVWWWWRKKGKRWGSKW